MWWHYREQHPKAPAELRSHGKSYKLVKARLDDGFSVDDLRKAIDGYHRSPFHQGVNERGTKYLSLELIMRDVDHVTKGIEMADDPSLDRGLSEKTRRTAHALGGWVERKQQERKSG